MAEVKWDEAPKAGSAVQWDEPAPAESTPTRLYRQYVAEPGTAALAKILHHALPGTGSLDLASSAVLGPEGGKPGEAVSRFAAETLMPQTPTQLATMAATGGASRLAAGARPALQALSRVTGGLLGNEAGNAIEQKPAGTGALATGGVLGGIETAVPVLGKVLRSFPGMKGRSAAQDAAKFGETLGEVSPPLAGARTVEDLRGLAQGPGQERLGAAKGAANSDIAQGLGARAGLLEIPSLGQTVPTPTAMNPSAGVQPVTVMKPATKPMTLQEANDALSEIGAKAFGKNPLDRNFNGVDQRQLYGKVYNEIQAALDHADPTGYSAAQFEKAQQAYKGGLALLRPLQSPNAYRNMPEGAQFNTPFFQQFLANPKTAASLRNKLGDQQFEALVATLTRGGGQGTKDTLAPGTGGMGQAGMEILRGKGGATQIPALLPRTFLPNFGSQYAGRQPFTAGPGAMTAADLAALRALGVLPGGQE